MGQAAPKSTLQSQTVCLYKENTSSRSLNRFWQCDVCGDVLSVTQVEFYPSLST